jgi:hypothetical protein
LEKFSVTNGQNSWGVKYSEISFICQALGSHQAVESFSRSQDILFDIVRNPPMPALKVVFVSEYRLGEAVADRAIAEFPGINAIVNNGNWNALALDEKAFEAQTGVVVIKVRNFLGALNNSRFGVKRQ